MKNYIKYFILFIITFIISIINVNAQSLYLTIDDSGVTCNYNCTEEQQTWYKFENDKLYLYEKEDETNYNNFYKITVKKEIEIIASSGVHVYQIYADENIIVTTESKNDSAFLDYFEAVDGDEEIYIKDANITLWSGIQYFSKVTIEDSFIDHRPDHKGGIIKPSSSNYSWGVDGNVYNPGSISGIYYNGGGMSLIIKDSTVYANQILTNGEEFILDNSKLYVISLAVNIPYGKLNNSTIENWYSDTAYINFFAADVGCMWTFDKMNFKNASTVNSSNYQKNRFSFIDSNFDGYLIQYMNINTTNSNIKGTSFNGAINANNSNIEFDSSQGYYMSLSNNSSFKSSGGNWYNYYPIDLGYRDYNIKVVDSLLDFNSDVMTYNLYCENSTINSKKIEFGPHDTTGVYKDNYVYVSNGCDNTLGKLTTYGDINLNNSTMISDGILIDDNDNDGISDGDLKMNESTLYVNDTTSNSTGITIKDLEFQNSHLISEATSNAWISKIDITTHNLTGINKNEIIIPMDVNGDYYSFYDNNEISKYVEIRSQIKITLKIENGTWSDGTTDDKIIDSYYFGKIKESDVPTGMKPNEGFGDGSWNKEIDYNNITTEATYTYSFKKVNQTVSDDEDDDEKPKEKKEKKELKNPDTGVFLPITIISILIIISIRILIYTKHKKLFRKI